MRRVKLLTNKALNVIKQAVKPSRFQVMFKKVWKRIADERGHLQRKDNLAWIRSKCMDYRSVVELLSPSIWRESLEYSQLISNKSRETLHHIKHDLGGGGIYPLLYFVTRLTRPQVIVETGVSAGFSSHAFLSAISKNNFGMLYSSDFPLFRLPEPEELIGILVDDELKDNWVLMIDGDEMNLPRIFSQVDHVDIFHYDSDKTYSGKKFAVNCLRKGFHDKSIIIFDDIQDDSFFHDFVFHNNIVDYYIFEFESKYVGCIGNLAHHFNN